MKIYVASSWRNEVQQSVVQALEGAGHEVYDFKNPPNNSAFQWSAIDPDWQKWTPEQFIRGLEHPVALNGFVSDMEALMDCDACVMVQPCGRSAHLEAGWASGAGASLLILLEGGDPELMYSMADRFALSIPELVQQVSALQREMDDSDSSDL